MCSSNRTVLIAAYAVSLAFACCFAGCCYVNPQEHANQLEQALKKGGFTNVHVLAAWATNNIAGEKLTFTEAAYFSGPSVSNLSNLAGIKSISPDLHFYQSQMADLSPLRHLPIESLFINSAPNISDHSLASLQGMKLRCLALIGAPVSDLTALRGMPLDSFGLVRTHVSDLSVLDRLELRFCELRSNRVSNISVLKGMPLVHLVLNEPTVTDLSAVIGAPLRRVDVRGSGIRDLTALGNAPLEKIFFSVELITNGMSTIRNIKTLKEINGMPAGEFWFEYDRKSMPENAVKKEPL